MTSNEITSTHEMAEADWDSNREPRDVDTDMVATTAPEGRGLEFHVSMRDYTMNDMEALIVEAAARQIVGRHNNHDLAKAIEAKCIEQVTQKADRALASVTAEIIDQPVTPKFPFSSSSKEQPVTMREFIGLTGQAYLHARVNGAGEPSTDSWSTKPRIQHLSKIEDGGPTLIVADAKIVPFSSIVGQSIALMDKTGRVIGQLAIMNLPAGSDYKSGSQTIAQQIINAIRGTS